MGLIFLKYISDRFEERQLFYLNNPLNSESEYYLEEESFRYEFVEDRDEYLAENIFYVPTEARWSYLQARAKTPEIGTLVDKAMGAIEGENPRL